MHNAQFSSAMVLYDGVIADLQKSGGVTTYFTELVQRLQKNQYVWLGNALNEVPVHKSEFSPAQRLFERYRNATVAKELKGVFHSTYYRLPNRKLPTVTTVHDFTYEKFVKGPAQWVHSWQKNKAIKGSDLVICVSENTALDLQRYCAVPSNKIRVIHNGVSNDYYIESNVTKTNEVLFVGARNRYKNFNIAVKAVSLVKDLSLSVVGGGAFSKEEEDILERYLSGRYRWLGRLTNEQLNVAYNRAYCLLYPSSYEGFGIPVLEAMRAGCPVIAVNASSIPEVAGNAAILAESSDVEEFGSILTTLNADSVRDRYSKQGLVQSHKFSWDKCFEETMSVYKELM